MTFICLLIFCKGGDVCFRQRVEKRRNKMLMKLLTGKKCKKSKKKQNKTKTVERIVSLSCKKQSPHYHSKKCLPELFECSFLELSPLESY